MSTINISNYIQKNKVANNSEKTNAQLVELNEILTANIKDKNDEYITLKGKNTSFDVSTKDVIFDGSDTVQFQVISNQNNTVELKQININSNNVSNSKLEQKSSEDILELFKQNNILVEEDISETDTKKLEEQKVKEIIRQIQNDILYSSNNTSESAMLELLSNNIDMTRITLNILTKVTNEIDKKPFESFSDEQIAEITKKYIDENNISPEGFEQKSEIIKSLKDSGLNVTNANIKQIENALSKFENALSKDNLEGLVELNDFTIDDLVEVSYSNNNNVEDQVSKNDDLYKALAEKLGLDYTQDVKSVFNSFLSKDIAITKENIDNLENIKNSLNSIDTKGLIDKMCEAISKGKKATDIPLLATIEPTISDVTLIEKTLDTKEVLENTTQENIASVIAQNKILTISNLKTAVTNNEQATVTEEISDQTSKAYKDLLTLMKKLTFESAYKLAKSGIDIDTKTVSDALEAVNRIEENSHKIALTSVDEIVNETNISNMKLFTDRLDSLYVLNKTYNKIDGNKIISDATEYSNLFKNSSLAYDVFSTKVSNKWNDKIVDYKTQIESILEDLQLETTDENIEACEILIKSKNDLTSDNILDVKTLNLKLDKIMDTLHPRMVANMINDGINPLSLDIDEIISYIDEYEELYGDNISSKLARNILDVQKDKTIDSDTVNAMKSFYKALNTVLKNDKASIGSIVTSEHNFTVKNLLDTAKYFNETKGINSMINEEVGDTILESSLNENSITQVINKAVSKSAYEQNLLEKLARNVDNASLQDFIENNGDFEQQLIQTLTTELEAINQKMYKDTLTQTDVSAFVDKLNQALSSSPLSINLLLQSDAKITLSNLSSVKDMLDSPDKIRQRLKQLISDDETLSDTFSEISEDDITSLSGVGSVLDVQIGQIENSMPSTQELIDVKPEILSSLNLMSLFNKSQDSNYRQMVIKLPLSDEVTTVNMFVLDDDFETKQTKTIAFSLQTDYLGDIEATLKINQNSADIQIDGNINGINYLKENEEEIKDLFLLNGYTDVTLNFFESDVKSIFFK